jgi:hypothetical protein
VVLWLLVAELVRRLIVPQLRLRPMLVGQYLLKQRWLDLWWRRMEVVSMRWRLWR